MQWTTWTRGGCKAGESSSREIERRARGRLANGRAWASRPARLLGVLAHPEWPRGVHGSIVGSIAEMGHGERECNTEPMVALSTEVLVIGGGSTGAGVVRDAAMRGFSAM